MEEISVHSSESLMRLVAGKYTVGAALGTLDLRSCDLIIGDLVHLQDVWPADIQVLNLVSVYASLVCVCNMSLWAADASCPQCGVCSVSISLQT